MTLVVADDAAGDFVAPGGEGVKTVTVPAGGTAIYSVATVDDGTEEADGRVTVSVAAGEGYTVGEPSSAAVAVNDNDNPLRETARAAVRETLAALARRSLSSALDNIGSRLGDIDTGGLTLAGRAVPQASAAAASAAPPCTAHAPDGRDVRAPDGCVPGAGSGGMTADELLRSSEFSLALGAAGPGTPLWSVWGRGDLGTFAGRGGPGMRYDGELRTGWLGLDARAGSWVAGLALSHGEGEAEYGVDAGGVPGRGRLETTLTALYPYARWTAADGLELRGAVGAGSGEARHRPEGGAIESGELSMRMASLGVRRELPALAGIALALRSHASLARLEIEDGPDTIQGLSADSWRLRAGLEASRRTALAGGGALEPFLEAALRHDGGDGLEGSGIELAGGLRYSAPGVEVEARGRWLAAHSEDGAREKGASLTARAGPGDGGRGPWFVVAPRWGAGTGALVLWDDEMPRPADGAPAQAALDLRLGYGFGLAGAGGMLTPFAEAGLAEADNRTWRLGTRFETPGAGLGIELAGERRESAAAEPEHVLKLDLRLRF